MVTLNFNNNIDPRLHRGVWKARWITAGCNNCGAPTTAPLCMMCEGKLMQLNMKTGAGLSPACVGPISLDYELREAELKEESERFKKLFEK